MLRDGDEVGGVAITQDGWRWETWVSPAAQGVEPTFADALEAVRRDAAPKSRL
ncbi:hypothetical protein [Paracoccus aminophilus]|uniref:hypothetical protein n=1 Tax=Paracoccus aminophilus TaxID=34003 RepID=UPI0004102FCF|nr:hypothetical protein [Paracoccus aminophilus]